MNVSALSTRAIGRAAIREELARVAFPQFCDLGFAKVTFEGLATAAGVSRSTFLRYFSSKEDVVLFAFDPIGEAIIDTLAAGACDEALWFALRRSVEPAVTSLTRDANEGLALLRLMDKTPALYARLHEKQATWRPAMVQVLTNRAVDRQPALVLQVCVAAALACLVVALQAWFKSNGRDSLKELVDAAFATFEIRSS